MSAGQKLTRTKPSCCNGNGGDFGGPNDRCGSRQSMTREAATQPVLDQARMPPNCQAGLCCSLSTAPSAVDAPVSSGSTTTRPAAASASLRGPGVAGLGVTAPSTGTPRSFAVHDRVSAAAVGPRPLRSVMESSKYVAGSSTSARNTSIGRGKAHTIGHRRSWSSVGGRRVRSDWGNSSVARFARARIIRRLRAAHADGPIPGAALWRRVRTPIGSTPDFTQRRAVLLRYRPTATGHHRMPPGAPEPPLA